MWEVDVGAMAVQAESSSQYPIIFCCHVKDGSRSAMTVVSDVKVWMQQSCVTEFPHVEKIALNDIQRLLLNFLWSEHSEVVGAVFPLYVVRSPELQTVFKVSLHQC